jgi:hypothetical protein
MAVRDDAHTRGTEMPIAPFLPCAYRHARWTRQSTVARSARMLLRGACRRSDLGIPGIIIPAQIRP